MTTAKIQEMLDRFYNAETTAREELMLKRFFQGDDVPPGLQADKLLFSQLFNDRVDVPGDLEARLSNDIDCWNMVEKSTLRRARVMSLRWIAGVAASLMLLFTLGTYLNNRPSTARPYANNLKETYDNPQDAAGETERALTKFSIAINKGLSKINNTAINERQ
jgi:hypothetical protein